MTVEGDLANVELAKVMQAIGARNKSGILTVQGEDDIVAVSFLEGGIVSADALNQTVEEGLGDVLRGKGLISAEDFSAIASEHQGGNAGSLAELLVNRGLVTRGELLEGLRMQTYRLLLQILPWTQGEFKFYGGDEVSYEEGFEPIPVAEFLVRSAGEASGGGGGVELPSADAVYRRHHGAPDFKVIGRDGDGTEEGLWLTEGQETLLRRLNGRSPASSVADAVGLDPYATRYAIAIFIDNDLVEVVVPEPEHLAESLAVEELTPEAVASLQAEIFTPPEPLEEIDDSDFLDEYDLADSPTKDSSAASLRLATMASGILAGLLSVALIWLLAVDPSQLLLPFQWNEPQKERLDKQVQRAQALRIDRAAKTYFLLKGHYPDALDELVTTELLDFADTVDISGQGLEYTSDDISYRLSLRTDSDSRDSSGASEGITGDFLLDPQFLRVSSYQAVPLVLLD